jgi:hypothetical protein
MDTRERILDTLGEISRLNPSVRLGQLVVNISYAARGWTKTAAWDVGDEEFLRAALSYLESLKQADPRLLTAQATDKQPVAA